MEKPQFTYWAELFKLWKNSLHFKNGVNQIKDTSIIRINETDMEPVWHFSMVYFLLLEVFTILFPNKKNDCPESTLIIHHVGFSGADNVIASGLE